MTAIAVSLATLVMTLLGGLFALHFKDRLHLILGFSAGAVLGVALFDLIPEALALGAPALPSSTVLALVAAGLLAYMVLDRAIGSLPDEGAAGLRRSGMLAVASLCFHSFSDGFVIGLGFRVSAPVGIAVAAAVLAHDFSDGINSVGLVLGKSGRRRDALGWLGFNAVMPVLGAALALVLQLSQQSLAQILAVCAGFFLYISASDLLPESYHDHPRKLTTAMTALGMLFLFLVTRAAEAL